MHRKINWEGQIGRRLRFRDLHVFFTVANTGSMTKAATVLGVSAPTVSEVIADLEHALGVRLLDRGSRGIVPTVYGEAFLKRGLAAFDELKQGIRDIEFLADPTVGEIRIGSDESIMAAMLPPIIDAFQQRHPKVVVDVDDIDLRSYPLKLREFGFDLVLTRVPGLDSEFGVDLNVQTLFEDELVVAAGLQTRWARRRKIDIAELAGERWVLAGPGTWNHKIIAEAFQLRGLPMPAVSVRSLSVHTRSNLLASGRYITALPHSVVYLNADRFPLKVLPLDLPARPWPIKLLTQKNRTLTPVVERFIACAFDVSKAIAIQPRPRRSQN
jgi:DNA-binding transcriptional LysR family regulator